MNTNTMNTTTRPPMVEIRRRSTPEGKDIRMNLTLDQAFALAQFVKRIGWSDWRSNAVDDTEAGEMRSACDQLRRALTEAGFAPR
jgi:GH24 family phage-related lysozyme (muramidase)